VKRDDLQDFLAYVDMSYVDMLAKAILLDQLSIHTKLDSKGNEYKQIKVAAFKDE
jgi:hypothetical protein